MTINNVTINYPDKMVQDRENSSLSIRIDPKLNYILDIIAKIDRVSKSEIVERSFWGNKHGIREIQSNKVEEVKHLVDYISKTKVNVTVTIDKELDDLISKAAVEKEVTKISIIENALWDYVEDEGFERDPVSEKFIKITIELPGRFKKFSEMA